MRGRINGGGCAWSVDLRALHPLKTAARRRIGWVGGWAAARACLMTPGGREIGRGAPIWPLNIKKSILVGGPPGLVHVRGGVGEVDFFGDSMPPPQFDRLSRAPRRALRAPVPPERGVRKEAVPAMWEEAQAGPYLYR